MLESIAEFQRQHFQLLNFEELVPWALSAGPAQGGCNPLGALISAIMVAQRPVLEILHSRDPRVPEVQPCKIHGFTLCLCLVPVVTKDWSFVIIRFVLFDTGYVLN